MEGVPEELTCRTPVGLVRLGYAMALVQTLLVLAAGMFEGFHPVLSGAAVLLWVHAFVLGRSRLDVTGHGLVRCNGVKTVRLDWDDIDHVLLREGWAVRQGFRAKVVVAGKDGTTVPLRIEGANRCERAIRRAVVHGASRRGIPVGQPAGRGRG